MKFTHQTLAIIALAAPLAVLGVPVDSPSPAADSTDDTSINHSKVLSDQIALSKPGADVAADGKCINIRFTTSNANWNYYFNGDWGLGTGTVGSLGTKSLCGSGAMFVGSQTVGHGLGAASGGNTKLECTVTGDGKGDNVCDISVVDGYSQSMHCTGDGNSVFGSIGGTDDLFNDATCPDVNNNGHTCVNTGGHTNNANQFFKNGGNYWYQDNTFKATTFAGTPNVHCAIHP